MVGQFFLSIIPLRMWYLHDSLLDNIVKILVIRYPKGVSMPMGPYKNFAACVAAQKKKGRSDEAAHRICGEIKKRAEGELMEKAQAWIKSILHNKGKDSE